MISVAPLSRSGGLDFGQGQREIPAQLADAGSDDTCRCCVLLGDAAMALAVPLFERRGNPRSFILSEQAMAAT